MKRLIVALTLSLSFITMNSFAGEVKVGDPVLESFKTSFKSATDVNWSLANGYYKVNFCMHQQYLSAFYNEEGQMLALTRNIASSQLPFALQSALKNDYENMWISDLFEMTNEQGTSYYITLENADTRIILKSNLESVWTPFKKTNKQ